MIQLPYETIGVWTVAVLLALAVEVVVFTVVLLTYAVWWHGWTKLSRLMWRGHDLDDPPPYRRRLVSVVAIVLRDRDLELWRAWKNELEPKYEENDD